MAANAALNAFLYICIGIASCLICVLCWCICQSNSNQASGNDCKRGTSLENAGGTGGEKDNADKVDAAQANGSNNGISGGKEEKSVFSAPNVSSSVSMNKDDASGGGEQAVTIIEIPREQPTGRSKNTHHPANTLILPTPPMDEPDTSLVSGTAEANGVFIVVMLPDEGAKHSSKTKKRKKGIKKADNPPPASQTSKLSHRTARAKRTITTIDPVKDRQKWKQILKEAAWLDEDNYAPATELKNMNLHKGKLPNGMEPLPPLPPQMPWRTSKLKFNHAIKRKPATRKSSSSKRTTRITPVRREQTTISMRSKRTARATPIRKEQTTISTRTSKRKQHSMTTIGRKGKTSSSKPKVVKKPARKPTQQIA